MRRRVKSPSPERVGSAVCRPHVPATTRAPHNNHDHDHTRTPQKNNCRPRQTTFHTPQPNWGVAPGWHTECNDSGY
eukprot:scaffold20826_cov126-Isochrysis_galbana.AAC.1